jgi:hypothetical protein
MSEHSHFPREGGELTRRTVLAGVAASTVAAGVAGVDLQAQAQTLDANKPDDMLAFIDLSSALTGIATDKLAPGFATAPPQPQPTGPLKRNQGSDPVDIKRDYFTLLAQSDFKATFAKLLQIAKDSAGAPDRDSAIIQKVQASDDTRYLGRSIVLMWYLGAWYDPHDLQNVNRYAGAADLKFSVISPKAYTQGWALSVAQAHPMGFSQFQFGYWSRLPKDRDDFIGKLA